MVRRKWLPPDFAPAWPACFPDSSKRSMDCGSSAASRSRIALDKSISLRRSRPGGALGAASRRPLLLLDVAGEKQRLPHDEHPHQPPSAEKPGNDPGIGGGSLSG